MKKSTDPKSFLSKLLGVSAFQHLSFTLFQFDQRMTGHFGGLFEPH